MALHTVELLDDSGADGHGGPSLEPSLERIARLRAQAEELRQIPEPNLFRRWTANAIHDLDQAAQMPDKNGQLSAFLDLIEEELNAAQRAHDRYAAKVA